MTLATRLVLVGASSLLAGVIAFALPLPASIQPRSGDRPHLTMDPTTAEACGCSQRSPAHHA